MNRQPPATQRRWGRWLLGLSVLAIALVWCESEEQAPPHDPPTVFVPTPLPEPELEPSFVAQITEPEAQPPDAGIADAGEAPPFDAGPPPTGRVWREGDSREYVQRWKDALAPLFRHVRSSDGPTLLKGGPPDPNEMADAGEEPCTPKVQRLSLSPAGRFDLIVVVDTSGSMWRALPAIAQWLGELEYEIVSKKLDVRLLVLADQRSLYRRSARPDGGAYQLTVGSTDALDVLIESASPPPWALVTTKWVDALRSATDLHIVLVTDDEATGKTEPYLQRLHALLGGVRFSVHLLGGLETPNRQVIGPDQPVASSTCVGEKGRGLEPGVVYQQLSIATSGLRAPFCYLASGRELSSQLLSRLTPTPTCAWLLSSPGLRVDGVISSGPRLGSSRLLHERRIENCYRLRRSFLLAGSMLGLCPDTCSALKAEGYDTLEVKLECQ